MRRPIATTALLLVLSAVGLVPSAGAQDSNLVSCSNTPSELTLRPGQSATVEVISDPANAEAISIVTLDGLEIDFDLESVESGTVSTVTYESIVSFIESLTGEVVSSGVFVQSLGNIVVVGEEVEEFEALCSLSITLAAEPEPTTTTVAPEPEPSPDPEPATPRFTG